MIAQLSAAEPRLTMETMTEHRPHSVTTPGVTSTTTCPPLGHDALLPVYDLLTRVLGMNKVYDTLIAQAELDDGMRVLEIGCGTGNLTIRAKRAASRRGADRLRP